MITSKIVENKESSNEFPKLMRSVKNGLIVLFTSKSIGTVLSVSIGSMHKLGDFSEFWTSKCFEDFTGELILKNKN
ncbi:MAG: hypothetical protein ACJA2M_000280 [Polaribacter sp.]|jgi:hypothetical protein